MNETTSQTVAFEAEVSRLMHLMVHALYSHKEVFLRELISNASDALDKLRFATLKDPELLGEDSELLIEVGFDRERKVLWVRDNGIGMSQEEIRANLGTIARSGTAEFLGSLSGDEKRDAGLIGQFGVGFYSVFMVAEQVEVRSRRADLLPEQGVCWSSRGEGSFTVTAETREQRGTEVLLHLKGEELEFADASRLKGLIHTYSDHIAFPVYLVGGAGREQVNKAQALWTRNKRDITPEEYIGFFKQLTHQLDEPLAYCHHRVEGRLSYSCLLYVPAHATLDMWRPDGARGLKLYVQRVFIMEHSEVFLPHYLRFVSGVVDTADLALNVSREMLQASPEVDSMRRALTRYVLDMLDELASREADRYRQFWKEFGDVLKEGIAEDPINRDRILKLLRWNTTKGEARSLEDIARDMPFGQKKTYCLVAESKEAALRSPHLEFFQRHGIEVILLTSPIDEWLIHALEGAVDKPFQEISKEGLDVEGLGDATSKRQAQEAQEAHGAELEQLATLLGEAVSAVRFGAHLVSAPASLAHGSSSLSEALQEVLRASGQAPPESARPVLELNPGHPLVQRLLAEADDARRADLIWVLLDEARLAQGQDPADIPGFLSRLNRLLVQAAPATPTS